MVVVEEVLKVCEILEKILKGIFGLNGYDVMLNLFLGEIFIINNGVLILRLLNLENFIGWIIVNKIVFFFLIFGDGVILFVLFLLLILWEVVFIIGMRDNFDFIEILLIYWGKILVVLFWVFYKFELSLFEYEVVVLVLNGIVVIIDFEVGDFLFIK